MKKLPKGLHNSGRIQHEGRGPSRRRDTCQPTQEFHTTSQGAQGHLGREFLNMIQKESLAPGWVPPFVSMEKGTARRRQQWRPVEYRTEGWGPPYLYRRAVLPLGLALTPPQI